MNLSRLFSLFCLLGFNALLFGQIKQKPKWELIVQPNQTKVGEVVDLVFKSKIEKDWYMYANDFSENVGPIVAHFDFKKHPSYSLVGKLTPKGSHKKFDDVFGGEVSTFTGLAEFHQKVKILSEKPIISVAVEFQECSQVTGQCVLFNDELSFKQIEVVSSKTASLEPNKALTMVENADTVQHTDSLAQQELNQTSLDSAKIAAAEPSDVSGKDQKSLLGFLIFAFGFGLISVLTPCVFPMLPMTVTFFTKKSETRSLALKRAFGFGLSIVLIYASLGFVFALFGLGPDFGNWLSTHWVPNVLFFIVFIVFASSFLGMFEITLPHQFVNKVDSKSSMGNFAGIFFMAFTLVLVSFSCTGPVVGSLLIEAVGGKFAKPLLGMAAFGAGLALPFTLFAIFPSWMHNLPKSGGWLNSVKVILGFLELAFAFKFLSIPDQTYHWGILDREIYIAIWIVIFFLMGLYLLGKLKFSHDSDVHHVSVPRLFFAIAVFSFVVYLIPGMFGAPLKGLSGYLPPQESLDFDLTQSKASPDQKNELTSVRFGNIFHLPHNIHGFFDFKEAIAYAKKVHKPIFIDFTGHGCVNCRKMESNVWGEPEVLSRLQEDYVVVALYVDDKTELPSNEWYISTYDQKEKQSIGSQNADFQISKYNANAQPYYVLVDENGNTLVPPKAFDLDVQHFVSFLDAGKAAFQKIKP